jgi:hypothetical protein
MVAGGGPSDTFQGESYCTTEYSSVISAASRRTTQVGRLVIATPYMFLFHSTIGRLSGAREWFLARRRRS